MSIFCKHKWNILSETTTVSKLELMVSTLGAVETELRIRYTDTDSENSTERKFIQIITCGGCGKLRRFVEYLS